MAEDKRVDPPEQPKTKELPAMTERALLEDLRGVVKEGFRLTNANLEVVSNDLGVVKDRVTILETERARFSGGVKSLSTANAEQDAQLAQERAAREALAADVAVVKGDMASVKRDTEMQTAILVRLDNIARNPLVKTLGAMLATALVTWLAAHGINIK